MSDLEDILRTH